jgi:hypothetical protein
MQVQAVGKLSTDAVQLRRLVQETTPCLSSPAKSYIWGVAWRCALGVLPTGKVSGHWQACRERLSAVWEGEKAGGQHLLGTLSNASQRLLSTCCEARCQFVVSTVTNLPPNGFWFRGISAESPCMPRPRCLRVILDSAT